MADYIIAIDQGTTSSRAIIFDKKGSICLLYTSPSPRD